MVSEDGGVFTKPDVSVLYKITKDWFLRTCVNKYQEKVELTEEVKCRLFPFKPWPSSKQQIIFSQPFLEPLRGSIWSSFECQWLNMSRRMSVLLRVVTGRSPLARVLYFRVQDLFWQWAMLLFFFFLWLRFFFCLFIFFANFLGPTEETYHLQTSMSETSDFVEVLLHKGVNQCKTQWFTVVVFFLTWYLDRFVKGNPFLQLTHSALRLFSDSTDLSACGLLRFHG